MMRPSRCLKPASLRCLLLFLAAWMAGTAVVAEETRIWLKNGDRLTGTVISETAEELILETVLGAVKVPSAQVERREGPGVPAVPPPVVVKPALSEEERGKALAELLQKYQAGQVTPAEYHQRRSELLQGVPPGGLAKAPPAPAPAPVPAAKPEGGAKPASKHQWAGQAQVGTDMGFGTKERQQFTGRVKVTYAYERFHSATDYQFVYGSIDGERSANRMDGSIKTDWDLTKKLYLYNIAGGGYDEIRLIDYKYEVGPGVGYQFWKTQKFALNGEAGVNYYVEIRDEEDDRERFYFRLAQTLTWKLTSRITWDEKFEWFPQAEDPSQYRFRLESNLQYLLGSNISLTVSILDQYDTDPAPNVTKNDVQVRSLVGLKF